MRLKGRPSASLPTRVDSMSREKQAVVDVPSSDGWVVVIGPSRHASPSSSSSRLATGPRIEKGRDAMFFAKRPSRATTYAEPAVERTELMAARRITARHGNRTSRRYLPVAALPMVALLLAAMTCAGAKSSINVVTTHLPAAQLRLALKIAHQYSDAPDVQVQVQVFEGTKTQPVFLAESARLTCDGSDIKPTPEQLAHPCPRRAPGEAYQIVFTDEYGATAQVMAPVPIGTFAVISPRPGALVPIPMNGAFKVGYSTPISPVNGSVSIGLVTVSCGAPQPSCGIVASSPQSYARVTPSVAPASPMVSPDATSCTPAAPPEGQLETRSEGKGSFIVTGDYGMFQPGPGRVDVNVDACATPDPGGFSAVAADFSDNISAPITWTR